MGITEKLRELIPDGYGYNSDFAHTMEAAAVEIERLQQGSDVLREELKGMSVIRGIDDRFGGRLALMLECAILNPTGYYDEACALLDEYKAEWEKVNPSPPTFMGEPMIRNCSVTDNMRDDDAARWRWITRAGRTRELRIPANEVKKSIDAAIDGARLKQAQRDAEESEAERQAMYGTFQGA